MIFDFEGLYLDDSRLLGTPLANQGEYDSLKYKHNFDIATLEWCMMVVPSTPGRVNNVIVRN